MATRSGQPKDSGVAWARRGPMNSLSSPSLAGQVVEAGLDRPVEVTDGAELLAPRDDVGAWT